MARLLVSLVEGYLLIGVVFAVPFVLRGVNRVDSLAREATWGFRVLILPGTVLLWPLLARRWRRGGGIPDEWNAHRAAARKGVTS